MSPPAPTIPGGSPPRGLGIGAASTTCARLAGNVLLRHPPGAATARWPDRAQRLDSRGFENGPDESIVLIKVTPSVVAH